MAVLSNFRHVGRVERARWGGGRRVSLLVRTCLLSWLCHCFPMGRAVAPYKVDALTLAWCTAGNANERFAQSSDYVKFDLGWCQPWDNVMHSFWQSILFLFATMLCSRPRGEWSSNFVSCKNRACLLLLLWFYWRTTVCLPVDSWTVSEGAMVR